MSNTQYELNKGLAQMLKGGVIMDVTTPEQAKIEIDYIDESEVLSHADDIYHIDKTQFKVPFVCGARDLGEAMVGISFHPELTSDIRIHKYFLDIAKEYNRK